MRSFLPDRGPATGLNLERLETVFWAARELQGADRRRYLDAECAGNPDLRRAVERMLAADDSAGSFLETTLPDALARDLPGDKLARWKLLERIGEGGLGVVYRAECEQDGVRMEAAVKILRPGFDTGKFRERFVRERRIQASLDHPAIVRLTDCGADEEGRSFLVMEFVRGEALDQHLARVNPSAGKRLELFETICDAVAYLHSRLIVHGDIKPSNVLVSQQCRPKLLDFGTARLLNPEDAAAVGELTRMILTPLYASPEQKRGEGPSVASDIYSLGRLLEEVLPQSVAPSDVTHIRRRCMAEVPQERYRSVSEVLEDLRRLREGLPLRARQATAIYVARRFLRRNWAVAILAALLVGSLAVGWWRADRASRLAVASAADADRHRLAAVESERQALENGARAEANAREAIASAARLDAIVSDLIDDNGADPDTLDQEHRGLERSLRRAAATMESLPGPPRWRELNLAWRRIGILLVHRGEFAAAQAPLAKAREAAGAWAREGSSQAARTAVVLTKLYELRMVRSRGDSSRASQLAHEALADLAGLPPSVQAELNGSVWLENARLAAARDLLRENKLEPVRKLFEAAARNSHARGSLEIRDTAVANLIWTLRRLSRLEDAERWCHTAQEWQVPELRLTRFCRAPLTAFTNQDPLFGGLRSSMSDLDLKNMLIRMDQVIKDLQDDPGRFSANLFLGRRYALLVEHYFATGQYDLLRPALRHAMAIRDTLVARDPKSPVVIRYQQRVDGLEKRAASELR